jgi:hypothetical protein
MIHSDGRCSEVSVDVATKMKERRMRNRRKMTTSFSSMFKSGRKSSQELGVDS